MESSGYSRRATDARLSTLPSRPTVAQACRCVLTHHPDLLTAEIHIKDARMKRVDPRKRPHYVPTERMAILELRAAR